MSRAVRRQQAATPKERPAGRQRIPGTRGPRQTRGAQAPRQEKRRLRAPGWAVDIVSELKKVTWPTPAETRYLTMVVIIVAVAVGTMLGVIDIFFNWLIDRLLLQ
jgi:preprotein translocase subunit SecE